MECEVLVLGLSFSFGFDYERCEVFDGILLVWVWVGIVF